MLGEEILEFIVDFYGVNVGIVVEQPLGHALGRVSGKSAKFKHPFGANHAHKHLEHAPLQVAGAHARIEQAQMGVAVELVQVLWLGIDVGEDIIV